MRSVNILISSRSTEAAPEIRNLLETQPGCHVDVRLRSNGSTDPLNDVDPAPDLLILVGPTGDELQSIANLPAEERPIVVVVGPGDDAAAVRQAMRAGAEDYLPAPPDPDELRDIVSRVVAHVSNAQDDAEGAMHVIMNGKGGSGASFLAANVAYGLATDNHNTTLVDLDLQCAGLCHYLDLEPKRGIFEAMRSLDELDAVSALAFTTEHASGVRLLSAIPEGLTFNSDVAPDRLLKLLETYQSISDYVIVDLPHHLDDVTVAVLEAADRITMVTQQSFPHLNDTSRLLNIMRDHLGISLGTVDVVVNRYHKDSIIEDADIVKALGVRDIVRIPSHYKMSSESVNTGVPLAEISRKGPVARGLRDLHRAIAGDDQKDGGLLRKSLPGLFRR